MRIRHVEIRNFRGIKHLSWPVQGKFNCVIGAGDSCKTTVLTALDFALSPRTALTFDDSDFFNQDISQDIVIQVTLADWDETQPAVSKFFQESKFAQFKCGLSDNGPAPEPQPNGIVAVSVSLRVDKDLEPKWFVIRGRDETDEQDRKPIYANDRAVLGLSRLDILPDAQFAWGRNTILTRLADDNMGNLNSVLATLAREMRQADIAGDQRIAACQTVADTVHDEAKKSGVKLAALTPKIDVQRQSMGAGALSLHENNVPLRNKGSGSKKLIAAAMQMKLHGGKNIALIDEIEMGLEPHRIRGLIHRLRNSPQQVFATTHSPVVLRELAVADNELYVCARDATGEVKLQSLATMPGIQGPVRANAEAFLGTKIVACEGPTEIGCLRAYNTLRFDQNSPPVWSLATSYFNCAGAGSIKSICPKLLALGYQVAVLCDNDAPDQLSADDVASLRAASAHVCQWDDGHSTERQLFADLPWAHVPAMLARISEHHDSLELATIIDCIKKEPRAAVLALAPDPAGWPESPILRQVIGDLAHEGKWIKRIDYATKALRFALPLLPQTTVTQIRLDALWSWIQKNE